MDKVLIAGDDPELLDRLLRELKRYIGQFEVVTAASGAEALEAMRKERISVLVSDFSLSAINGLELLDHMRKHRPQIPCIVMTDPKGPDIKHTTDRNHILGCLTKPVDAGELFALIMEGLDRLDEGMFWREQRNK